MIKHCALAVALLTAGTASAHDDDNSAPLRCRQVSFAVALDAQSAADNTVVGWLCSRGSIEHRTIQLLVHGGTYDHSYWDFPFQPERYSYVRAMTDAGYATLAIDCLGAGLSSRPDGLALTAHSSAFAVHQVIEQLRAGFHVPGFGRLEAKRIILVGHSLGSFISTIEASTYNDVDALILSAYSHSTGPGVLGLEASLYPAAFDPKFAANPPPENYITTLPGTRAGDFYYAPTADPAVIAVDEQLKQTATLGELFDLLNPATFAASSSVTVPTLVAVGDFDSIDCQPPSCSASNSLAAEASFFGTPRVQVVDFPNAGHDLNLQENARDWFLAARVWADWTIGR
jgi:pimeloyl-ACP methyl ester carboxylesterase